MEEQLKKIPGLRIQYYKEAIKSLCQDWFNLKGSPMGEEKREKIDTLLRDYKYKQIFELMNL